MISAEFEGTLYKIPIVASSNASKIMNFRVFFLLTGVFTFICDLFSCDSAILRCIVALFLPRLM